MHITKILYLIILTCIIYSSIKHVKALKCPIKAFKYLYIYEVCEIIIATKLTYDVIMKNHISLFQICVVGLLLYWIEKTTLIGITKNTEIPENKTQVF